MAREIAVLTGDIVKSRDLAEGELDRAFRALGTAAERIGVLQGAAARLSRFRGDGWQMAVTDLRFVLRATLVIRAALRSEIKALSTRIALGIGPPGHMPDADLSAADGKPFEISGSGLDTLASRKRVAPGNAPPALAASLILSEPLADGWTKAQAGAVLCALALPRRSQASIAVDLETSQQNVQKLLSAASFDALDAAMALFEEGEICDAA